MGKGAGRWEVDMVKNRDTEIRLCAFSRLDVLIQIHGTSVPWSSIAQGFHVGSESILFATTVEGIFKPRQMDQVLSIKTVVPKPGGKVWYQDQIRDEQIASPEEIFCYSFKGTDPDDPKNRLLERAMILNLPLIYFYGINRPGAAPPLPSHLSRLYCRMESSFSVLFCRRRSPATGGIPLSFSCGGGTTVQDGRDEAPSPSGPVPGESHQCL